MLMWSEIEAKQNPYPEITCKIQALSVGRYLSIPAARDDGVVPAPFARDIAYLVLLGGKNCNAIKLEWRLKDFNGLGINEIAVRKGASAIYPSSVLSTG